VFYTATTLDGYLADEHDSLDWLFVQPIDEDGPMSYKAFIADIGALVMGRPPIAGLSSTVRLPTSHGRTTSRRSCSRTASHESSPTASRC